MKNTFVFFFTLISALCSAQSVRDNLIGDWVEVRREQRNGYVYTIGGALNVPCIQLGFRKDNTVSFYNPCTPDPEFFPQYLVIGDTLLAVKEDRLIIFEILKSNTTDLILVWRVNKKYKDDFLDQKLYFIHKDRFDELTQSQKDKLKAPTEKDKGYLARILAQKKG